MKKNELLSRKCEPCKSGTMPLEELEITNLLASISPEWQVIDLHHLTRSFVFSNFQKALDFTVAIGAIAEQEGHHPDIELSWGKVKIVIWTHKIKGLSINDFILASKIDQNRTN